MLSVAALPSIFAAWNWAGLRQLLVMIPVLNALFRHVVEERMGTIILPACLLRIRRGT